MKKYLYLVAAVLVTSLFIANNAKATHMAGGEITYSYISPNTYLITVKLYRDCSPNTATMPTSIAVCYSSPSGGSGNITCPLVAGSGQMLPPTPCVTAAQCYQEWMYQGTGTLPSAQPNWKFSYDLCCRNNAITTLTPPGGNSMYIYTTLDNVAAPVNSAPIFTYIPNIRFCVNNQFYYNPGAVDPDGDSLSYALDVAETGGGGCPPNPVACQYVAPWSSTNPITTQNGTNLDPVTGTVSFFPTQLMIGVVCVQVTEWRTLAGVPTAIGTIKRDIQVNIVGGCTIITPTFANVIMQNGIQASCGDNTFILSFSDPIQCGSVVATDVRVTDPYGFPNPVISAVPINCSNNLCDSILVTVFNPLIGNGDTTYAFTKVGNDGNTFLGECGTQMPEFDSIAIIVNDTSQFTILQENVGCYFDSVTLNFNVDMWCQTIANDLSDLTLKDALGTVIPINSITSNCIPGNPFSYQSSFTLHFTGGTTGVSPLYLTVNTGTDANTIANKCGTFFNPGDTLAILTILNNIPINLGNDLTVCDSDPLPVLNGGLSGVTYQWLLNGNVLPDTTQSITAAVSGTYIVNINYGATCTGSDTIVVTISPSPAPNLGQDITLCVGDTIPTLNSGVSGATSYQWYNGGVLIPGATNSTYTPGGAGNYTVIVSIGTCTGTDSLTITINNGLPVALGNDLTLCTDDIMPILNANVTANSYQWYNNGVLIPGATQQTYPVPNTTGTTSYSVIAISSCTGTDTVDVTINAAPNASLGPDTSVCITDTLTLNAQDPGPTYQWYNGGVLITGATNQTYVPTQTGLYSVVVINSNNCDDTAFVNVTVYTAAPTPTVNNVTYCSGTSITPLNAGVTGVGYQWYNGATLIPGETNQTYQPTSPGTYTVVVSAGTCTASGQGTVTEVQTPIIALNNPAPICQGQPFPQIDAGAQPAGYTYLWSTGETTQIITSTAAITYTVTITNSQGGISCTATDSVAIIVNQNPVVAAGTDQTICAGAGNVSFTASGSFTNPTYVWSNGATTQSIQPNNAGTYTVTVTDNGCTGSDDVTLWVNPLPVLNLSSTVEIETEHGESHNFVCVLDPFPVISVSAPGNAAVYNWTYTPTGGSPTTLNVSGSSYQVPASAYGQYTIEVIDSNSCRSTVDLFVEEDPCDPIFYNIITPNSDGDNDAWQIGNFDISFPHMVQIFNRWGQELLSTSSYKNDWDGDDLPDGTYYYIVTYNSKDYKGTITKISNPDK